MASGSMVSARAYAKKVFAFEEAFAKFTDDRLDPTVPLTAILTTWLWAFVRRLPSTEQVGDLLLDERWRRRIGLKPEDGGSPDTMGRGLNELLIDEWNELLLSRFFLARRAGILKEGPYGMRCAIIDLNELFTSKKVHCDECQKRKVKVKGADGESHEVDEYFHQAVALVWACGEMAFPIQWELLKPGEGELTAAQRLLERILPRLSKSIDLVMGDALYCCRPFFEVVCKKNHIGALAISSGSTEMDGEMSLLLENEPGRKIVGADIEAWEMESEAWEKDLGCKLRVAHYNRLYPAPDWKKERRQLRIVSTVPVAAMPIGQGWKIGRYRWRIENGTFNILTRDYSLDHNFRHSAAAILGLLVLRSLAYCFSEAYRHFATARSKTTPKTVLRWFQLIFVEDWVRYLDGALVPAVPDSG